MITAIDTNVLLDVFKADKTHAPKSMRQLRRICDMGSVVICNIVYA